MMKIYTHYTIDEAKTRVIDAIASLNAKLYCLRTVFEVKQAIEIGEAYIDAVSAITAETNKAEREYIYFQIAKLCTTYDYIFRRYLNADDSIALNLYMGNELLLDAI